MNVNIALNTIIRIIVFLFSRVLFRKFYFSSQFENQFEQGNLLERFSEFRGFTDFPKNK